MHILVLGAGYAGLNAAIRLARRSRGLPARPTITLASASDTFVERIRLHETAAGLPPSRHSIGAWLARGDVRFVVGEAASVDRRARTATLVDGQSFAWDRLVLALGSRTDTRTEGAAEHTVVLEGGGPRSLAARLPTLARTRGTVLVVGGGLTGIEAATEIAEAWPEVRVVLAARGEIGAGFSAEARAHFARALDRLGVVTMAGTVVTRVERDRVIVAGGRHVPFDACVWTVGFVGAPLPQGLDLSRNARAQVLVDASLRSIDDPQIYVAGDLATLATPPAIPVPMGCKSAAPAGAHVADNLRAEITGEPLRPFDYVAPGYCVSLGRHDAIVQLPRKRGDREGRVLRGRLAVWTKELIGLATVWTFAFERLGLVSYAPFAGGNVAPRALGPAERLPHGGPEAASSCNALPADPTTVT